MSTVADKPRSRASLLSKNLERLYGERDKLRARLAELPELEEQARLVALQKAPTRRTDALGSEVQKLRDDYRKKVAALERIEIEISAVERATREAKIAELEQQLADTSKEAAGFAKAEAALWRQAGDQLADLADTFAQLRDQVWEPRERRRETLRHGELANVLNASEEAQSAFDGAWHAPVRPIPATLPTFVSFLVEAAVDPRGFGYRAATGGPSLDAERRITSLVSAIGGDVTRPAELLRTERWNPNG